MNQHARIVAAHGRHYVVVTDTGERLVCFTRGKKSEAACGDSVEIVATGSGQGVLDRILPRRNLLSRSNGFRTKLLAANVDQIAIVVATSPPFSEELLGRTIVAAVSIDVPVRILLNKVDLVDKLAWARETLASYVRLGYPVDEVSIRRDEADAYARLSPLFAGKTTLLVGQSGMGKSSLLNLLVPDAQAATREISEALQTGKHTTTDARLYALPRVVEMVGETPTGLMQDAGEMPTGLTPPVGLPAGVTPPAGATPTGLTPPVGLPAGVTPPAGAIVDTPGFQEFGLAHLTPGTVERGFPELAPFLGHCRFANCMHLHEPGCAVLAARDRGDIAPRRYDLFVKLTRESATFRDR